VNPEKVIVAPDCGLKYLPRDVGFGKMTAMVEGARLLRAELGVGPDKPGHSGLHRA
jgi:5-methyltetrahydropteroyltriglutamate--homocysteine methyltransferase